MMSLPNHLIDRRPSGLGLAASRHRGERTGRTIEVGIYTADITTHLIHISHDEQLIAKWLEWLKYPS